MPKLQPVAERAADLRHRLLRGDQVTSAEAAAILGVPRAQAIEALLEFGLPLMIKDNRWQVHPQPLQ